MEGEATAPGKGPEVEGLGAAEAAGLLEAARRVAENAWAPYSHFHVGAAVLDGAGRLFTGCNVEVASYRLTTCAEQAAVAAAVAAGARRIRAVAVVSPERPECLPCGACRQTLAEFAGEDLPVLLEAPEGGVEVLRLGELLPRLFRLEDGEGGAGGAAGERTGTGLPEPGPGGDRP